MSVNAMKAEKIANMTYCFYFSIGHIDFRINPRGKEK